MAEHDVYRDGRIHVRRTMCKTCVFRPGNLMRLQPGRVEGMVRDATRDESCIPCHTHLHGGREHDAVCRGFYDRHATLPLRLAAAMDLLAFVEDDGR